MNAVESPGFDIDALRGSAHSACRLMRAMSNPDRLLLLCQLSEAERCVSELETLTGILQPTLSQQLGVLRDDGLVDTRREGKRIYYRIVSEAALALIRVLHDQFCRTTPE